MRIDRTDDDLDDAVGNAVDIDVHVDSDDDLADDELEDVVADRLGERLNANRGIGAEEGEAGLGIHARPDTPGISPRPETAIAGPERDDPQDRAEAWTTYRDNVDDIYRAYAIDQGCERVREIEEKVITPALQRIEAEDPSRHLVGLDHCLKGKDRLKEKVNSYFVANPSLSCDDAFAKVKDTVRYTFQYPDQGYANGVRADCERLKSESFVLVELRNTWDNEDYKGINSRWKTPDNGQLFEVQFHTEDSFNAKQETHPAYEKLRRPETPSAERDEMRSFQREVTARVPVPAGAADIPDYSQERHASQDHLLRDRR